MTKGETAKRISATVGAGLVLYLVAYGPIIGYSDYMMVSRHERWKWDKTVDYIYLPIMYAESLDPSFEAFGSMYVKWCEKVLGIWPKD